MAGDDSKRTMWPDLGSWWALRGSLAAAAWRRLRGVGHCIKCSAAGGTLLAFLFWRVSGLAGCGVDGGHACQGFELVPGTGQYFPAHS